MFDTKAQEEADRIVTICNACRYCEGLCAVFLQHTSASLVLCENADPDVPADLTRAIRTDANFALRNISPTRIKLNIP